MAYCKYKSNNWNYTDKIAHHTAKIAFRDKKRQNLKLRRDRNYRQLFSLFKYKKDDFWRRIKHLEKRNHRINIDIDKLKAHYELVFNQSNLSPTENNKFENKVKHFKEEHKNCIFEHTISVSDIQNMIGNLANNKAIGLRGVSNEMLKYSNSLQLFETITKLFNGIISLQILPNMFNLSVLKPIIKCDSNKR